MDKHGNNTENKKIYLYIYIKTKILSKIWQH